MKITDMITESSEGDSLKFIEKSLEKIKRDDPKYNIFLAINAEVPEKLPKGKLSGIPIAIKDNIIVKGLRTTCGSLTLENFVPNYNSTVAEKIIREGGFIVGKTNMDEFAMGALGTNSAFGPTLNPLNPLLSPGGSSSGSAAAVADGVVPIALGSDTGGSIRLPSAWTAVYGIKPTYGTVSRFGLISYADSLEQIGAMANSSSNLAYIHSIIAGYDTRDPTSQPYQTPNDRFYKIAREEPEPSILKGLKLAVVQEFMSHPLADEEAVKTFWNNAKILEEEGAVIELVSEPLFLKAPQIYYVIAFAEASSNLARYDGVRYGSRVSPIEDISWNKVYMRNRTLFGWEVKRRIILGTFILSEGYYEMYYSRALKARALVKDRVDRILSKYNFILTPGTLIKPLPIEYDATDLSKLNAIDSPLVLANLTGYPALTLPFRRKKDPLSTLQLMGPMWSDDVLLMIARALDALSGWE
jgi:aspartyl-tRNA(Asn)/glutamyl-tRNA(Gln) amidotransferase subunit A